MKDNFVASTWGYLASFSFAWINLDDLAQALMVGFVGAVGGLIAKEVYTWVKRRFNGNGIRKS